MKPVPDPPYSFDVAGIFRLILDFVPKVADVDHDDIVVHSGVVPDQLIELFLGEHLAGMG